MIKDFIDDHMGKILLIVFCILIFMVVVGYDNVNEKYEQLMVECMKDHKEYECVSMLGQKKFDNDTPTFTPIPGVHF